MLNISVIIFSLLCVFFCVEKTGFGSLSGSAGLFFATLSLYILVRLVRRLFIWIIPEGDKVLLNPEGKQKKFELIRKELDKLGRVEIALICFFLLFLNLIFHAALFYTCVSGNVPEIFQHLVK